jgi:hypothetical protein
MAEGKRAPLHLWLVGVLSLGWNGFGAFDYLMSVTRNAAYLGNFPPEMITLLDSFPMWANAVWAIGVWASVLGSVLLLVRSRHAVAAFMVSLLGAVGSFVFQLGLEIPPALGEMMTIWMPLAIVIIIALQGWYARSMAAKGVLR